MASKKSCIVTAIAVTGTGQCQIYFDDNRYINKIISAGDCFKNPEKTSDFIKTITSLISPSEIKAFLLIPPVTNSIKDIQPVKMKIKEFCEKNGIFCCFPPHLGLLHMGMILASKSKISDGENILLVTTALFLANVHVYKRTKNEFVSVDGFKFPVTSDIPLLVLKKHILKNFEPKKIIVIKTSGIDDELMSLFEKLDSTDRIVQALTKCDVTVLNDEFGDLIQIGSEILINHLMGEKMSEYMVKFFCDRDIKISSLINCGGTDNLPLEKSVIYKVKKKDNLKITENDHGVIQSIDLSEYAFRQVKITLKIDENMFYDLQVVPISPPTKKVTVAKLEEKAKESGPKAKLIFTQNDYMIFAWKNGKKKITKDFVRSTKIPFSISFANEIPAIGEKAMNDLIEKPQFVVYDLLKLCQPNILKDRKWPFKIIQDSETKETLIQFETFRGPRKASADFLFSLILKNSMVLIERETGVKIEEFGIEVSGIDESESIKRCLEKAAERIKLKITFL